MTSKAICLVYMDDCSFFTRKNSDIKEILEGIEKQDPKYTIEEDTTGFLGVMLKRSGGKI
eukprot:1139903-Ditylum_brightwellii.AAC.2